MMFEFASTCPTPSFHQKTGTWVSSLYIWDSTSRNLANSGSPTNRFVPLAKLVYNIWLVVENMKVRWDYYSQCMKKIQTTNQICIYIWLMADIPIANGGYKPTLLSLGTFHHVPTKKPGVQLPSSHAWMIQRIK